MDPRTTFDESEIRAAERRREASLDVDDATAWVFDYTEDAVFDGLRLPSPRDDVPAPSGWSAPPDEQP